MIPDHVDYTHSKPSGRSLIDLPPNTLGLRDSLGVVNLRVLF